MMDISSRLVKRCRKFIEPYRVTDGRGFKLSRYDPGDLGKLGKDIIGVAFDSGVLIKTAVRDGKLAGAVTQDPLQIGYKTVELCVKAIKGEPVSDVDTGCQWYTAENMDDPKIAPNLYD